jgi:hypothetical protein
MILLRFILPGMKPRSRISATLPDFQPNHFERRIQ